MTVEEKNNAEEEIRAASYRESQDNDAAAQVVNDDPLVLREKLVEQSARADDLYDRLLRLQADYENFRRRTRQEKADLYKYASEQVVSALLPVLDNFGRALAAEGDSLDSFKTGVEMIFKQIQEVLAREGVTLVPSVGEQFDPQIHEAALQVESAEHPDNTITEEFRPGYYLHDKVIRPAMVKVARSQQPVNSNKETYIRGVE